MFFTLTYSYYHAILYSSVSCSFQLETLLEDLMVKTRIVVTLGFFIFGLYLVTTTPEWVYQLAAQIGSADLIRLAIAVAGVGIILILFGFFVGWMEVLTEVAIYLFMCGILLFMMSTFGGYSEWHQIFAEMMGVLIIIGVLSGLLYAVMFGTNKKATTKA